MGHTFLFFFLFIQPQLLLHFFFPFSFFVAVCLLLCFYSFFPLFLPLVFLVSIFIHFMSPMFHIFFLCFVNKNTRYTILYTEQKNYLFFPSKKKRKKFPQKNHIMISNCCVIFTRSSTCVYRHIKN